MEQTFELFQDGKIFVPQEKSRYRLTISPGFRLACNLFFFRRVVLLPAFIAVSEISGRENLTRCQLQRLNTSQRDLKHGLELSAKSVHVFCDQIELLVAF